MTAAAIVAIRERAHLSQAALARHLGVSAHTVANWEQGLRRPGGPAILMLEVIAREAGKPAKGRKS
jgi:putative transcriptional regulator